MLHICVFVLKTDNCLLRAARSEYSARRFQIYSFIKLFAKKQFLYLMIFNFKNAHCKVMFLNILTIAIDLFLNRIKNYKITNLNHMLLALKQRERTAHTRTIIWLLCAVQILIFPREVCHINTHFPL